MSEHRRSRRQLRMRGAFVKRVPTGMGRLVAVITWLRMRKAFVRMLRRPCHVADIYINGRFYDERYVLPKGDETSLRLMKTEMRELIGRRSRAAFAAHDRFNNLVRRGKS